MNGTTGIPGSKDEAVPYAIQLVSTNHPIPAPRSREQQLRFGQGQTQVGDVDEITGPVYLHDVRARSLALSPGFHQPQNPGHPSTLGQRTDTKIPNWPAHPQSCGSPQTEQALQVAKSGVTLAAGSMSQMAVARKGECRCVSRHWRLPLLLWPLPDAEQFALYGLPDIDDYTSRSSGQTIDLDAIVTGWIWPDGSIWDSDLHPRSLASARARTTKGYDEPTGIYEGIGHRAGVADRGTSAIQPRAQLDFPHLKLPAIESAQVFLASGRVL